MEFLRSISSKERRMVFVLLAGAVLVVLNQTFISPALPVIMRDVSVDATTAQWLVSAFALTEAIVIPLSAWCMGRFSTRQFYMGAIGLFAIGSLVAAIAPSFVVLLIGRILQAAAAGVLMTLVASLILITFPREYRGQAMGMVSLVLTFAPAVGPSIGGVLIDSIGWRALFIAVMALAVIVILCSIRFLYNYEKFERTKFDVLSVIVCSIGLVALLYGISSIASSTMPIIEIALIVLGAVLLVLYAVRQMHLPGPMLEVRVLKSRKYRTGVIVNFLLYATLVASGVLMPLYVQDVLGYSATISGLVVLPGALLGCIAAFVSGRLFDSLGARAITLIGGAIVLCGGIGMCLYQMDSPLYFVIGANFVFAGFLQFLITPITTWGLNSMDNSLVQHATAFTNTVNQVGGSLGTALIVGISALGSALVTSGSQTEILFGGYRMSFFVLALLLAIVFVLIIFFVRDFKHDTILKITPSAVAAEEEELESLAEAAETGATISDLPGIIDPDPLTLPNTMSITEAVDLLADKDASGAPVLDENGSVIGFLSTGDIIKFFGDEDVTMSAGSGFMILRSFDDDSIAHRVAAFSKLTVADIATSEVMSIHSSEPLVSACNTLATKRFKELPVIDDGKLIGVMRRRNLMHMLAAALYDSEKDVEAEEAAAAAAENADESSQD